MTTNPAPSQPMARHMVLGQLYTNDIVDKRILDAMRTVPRERFVPERLKGAAYVDDDLEIAPGRFLIEPLVFAQLLDLARITTTDRVLVIGCSTGYSAAVIASLARQVVAIETDQALLTAARQNITSLGLNNVECCHAQTLDVGYAGKAPYDVIVIDGAVEAIPDAVAAQLADNGRLVTVRNVAARPGSAGGLGKGLLVMRLGQHLQYREHFDASVPLVPGFAQAAGFHF